MTFLSSDRFRFVRICASPHTLPLLLVSFCTFASVAFLLRHLDPQWFPDSDQYWVLAREIAAGAMSGFEFRTPAYPAFLAFVACVLNGGAWTMAAIQILLSSTVPFLLYGLFYSVLGRRWIALLCALMYFVCWDSQAVSVAVLTESFTQLFLVLTTFLAVILVRAPGWRLAVATGSAAVLLIMTRPAFLPLPMFYAVLLFCTWWKDGRLRQNVGPLLSAVGIPCVCVLLWCFEVRRETGVFAISHVTGVALINQMADQLPTAEASPDPELVALLREQIRAEGRSLNVGWDALRVKRDAGIPDHVTARRLKELSLWLILQNPMAYLKKVTLNFRDYYSQTGNYVFTSSRTHTVMMSTPFPGGFYSLYYEQFRHRPARQLVLFGATAVLALVLIASRRLPYETKVQYLVVWSGLITCLFGHILVNGADLGRYSLPAHALYLATAVATVYLVMARSGSAAGWRGISGEENYPTRS